LTQEKNERYFNFLFLAQEKKQKKYGLKYFTKNSAPFHCEERTRFTQTASIEKKVK
jgi:hypothetical protein